MTGWDQELWEKNILQALKIAIGSCTAIFIAEMLHLDHALSAGSIALLTIVTTKWATVRLAAARLMSFFFSVAVAFAVVSLVDSEWLAFGIFVFSVVIFCYMLQWNHSISVNAVTGAHLVMADTLSDAVVRNELLLVLIGIVLAILLNLLFPSRKRTIIHNMRESERMLQSILTGLADYLCGREMDHSVWEELTELEEQLEHAVSRAYEYQDNTWASHPAYYIRYFEMRARQCSILHNLHEEMRRIRDMPEQAALIADYLRYLKQYVVEINAPDAQIEQLERMFQEMKKQPLPRSRQEFENRAILYHILMDIEEFLLLKKRFVETLDEKQKRIYWVRPGR